MQEKKLYALIKAGFHGSNGLNPKGSYRIYQAYVIPRLLFNLETLHLNKTQLNQLQRFRISTLEIYNPFQLEPQHSLYNLYLEPYL